MEYKKNQDGTDELDEQGNPIPVTITDEGKESAKVQAQLVDEIKDLRLKLGISEALLKDKEEKKPETPPGELTDEQRLEALLDKKLNEKAASDAKANKKAAFEKFIAENKEFNPDNDSTGLKRDALQKKLDRFNTEGLFSVNEFLTVIGEAKTLLLGNDNQADTTKDKNPYSNPQRSPNTPEGKRDEGLTPRELKLAQITGKTKEQILKLKLKNPEFLAGLMDYVRD